MSVEKYLGKDLNIRTLKTDHLYYKIDLVKVT